MEEKAKKDEDKERRKEKERKKPQNQSTRPLGFFLRFLRLPVQLQNVQSTTSGGSAATATKHRIKSS